MKFLQYIQKIIKLFFVKCVTAIFIKFYKKLLPFFIYKQYVVVRYLKYKKGV